MEENEEQNEPTQDIQTIQMDQLEELIQKEMGKDMTKRDHYLLKNLNEAYGRRLSERQETRERKSVKATTLDQVYDSPEKFFSCKNFL
jgi:hypothetical protein